MAIRSLYANQKGLVKAKEAMARKRWTQEFLAGEVGLKTRQPIGRFLIGKAVDRRIFIEICFQLDLDWQEIAQNVELDTPQEMNSYQDKNFDNDSLVQRVRSQCQEKIDAQCSTLHMLDLPQPINLADIYIDMFVMEEIANRRWLEIPDLLQNITLNPDEDQLSLSSAEERIQERVLAIDAITKYSKLMLLGKPGTGKSTFLRFIALQCNQGKFQSHRLPIYIELRYFAEDAKDQDICSLQNYIYQELDLCGVSAEEVKVLLAQGKLLILLDGLDEVPESDLPQIIREIRRLTHRYYKNQFIITCRLAAHQYRFQGFTEVEIANFSSDQIAAFAQKYFVAISRKNQEDGLSKASQFIEQLQYPENLKIRELAVTPLLLNLTCLVFQSKTSFPSQHSKLYQEGLDVLLVKWDQSKGVKRDEAYQKLSLVDKLKLLNNVGAKTFEQESYFFEQSQVEYYIADYLRELPDTTTDPIALHLDSQAVLKSLERQHGLLVERSRRIYSFSHLTFQEYFTARCITCTHDLEVDNKTALKQLVNHITGKRWREIFLLVAGMLRQPNDLIWLMKQQIDQLLIPDEKLLQFVSWIDNKSHSVSVQYKLPAVRAFYFCLALTFNNYLNNILNPDSVTSPYSSRSYFPLALILSLPLALDPDFTLHREIDFNLNLKPTKVPHGEVLNHLQILDHTINCAIHFDLAVAPTAIRELQRSLHTLTAQLPNQEEDLKQFNLWWEKNHQAWTEQFIAIIHKHYNKGHDWQFSEEQTRLLWQYYQANKLLVDCLNSSYELTPEVRSHFKETLLLVATSRINY